MSIRRYIHRFLGQFVECHTMYGSFQGVIIHCTKNHVILAPIPRILHRPMPTPGVPYVYRQMPMGPGGPGWGGGGPGWGGGGGGGGGWHMAIPLAAILGITALGMHWW